MPSLNWPLLLKLMMIFPPICLCVSSVFVFVLVGTVWCLIPVFLCLYWWYSWSPLCSNLMFDSWTPHPPSFCWHVRLLVTVWCLIPMCLCLVCLFLYWRCIAIWCLIPGRPTLLLLACEIVRAALGTASLRLHFPLLAGMEISAEVLPVWSTSTSNTFTRFLWVGISKILVHVMIFHELRSCGDG